jgi:hypothetical protein
MKKHPGVNQRKPKVGRRIIASLQVAVDWVESNGTVRVTTVEVPVIDVRATLEDRNLSGRRQLCALKSAGQ